MKNPYTLICQNCEDELYEGSREEVEHFVKKNWYSLDWEDSENIAYTVCGEYSCKMD